MSLVDRVAYWILFVAVRSALTLTPVLFFLGFLGLIPGIVDSMGVVLPAWLVAWMAPLFVVLAAWALVVNLRALWLHLRRRGRALGYATTHQEVLAVLEA